MTKQERAEMAREHVKEMRKKFPSEIQNSICNTKIYGLENFPARVKSNEKINRSIWLMDTDSVSCLEVLNNNKTAILNFASYKYPGGGFISGMMAQEEALCHTSTLYPCISAFEHDYYKWNRERLNKGLYLDRALYTPDVLFEFSERIVKADVITCAAPNYRVAHTYQGVTFQENQNVFKHRIQFMFSIAEANDVSNLILGAWGCGVFMQNPYNTCEMIVSELEEGNYNIQNIYFPIPNKSSRNYKEFQRYLYPL